MSGTGRFGDLMPSRRELEHEVEDELAFHLEMRAEKLRRSGLDARQAKAVAQERFGDVETIRASCLELSTQREKMRQRALWLRQTVRDLAYAFRGLRRQPGFTTAVVLSLAIGIGGNAALFSLFDAVLLRSLPYDQPEELVSPWPGMHALAELEGLRKAEVWQGLAAYGEGQDWTLTGEEGPLRVQGATISTNLLDVLRVSPLLGRGFRLADGEVGAEPVVLLGESLWRARYRGEQGVLGRSIQVDGNGYTVVGVMPSRFRFPEEATAIWLPQVMDDRNQGAWWGSAFLNFVGRLAPEATLETVTAAVRRETQLLREANPIWTPAEDYGQTAVAVPLQEELGGDLRSILTLLFGAGILVQLIVCLNVATLLLARATARRREVALRASLGAGRSRLVALLLSESFVLAGAGGLLGVLMAEGLVRFLLASLPDLDARFGSIQLDGRALLFVFGISALSAILFGMVPAWRLARTDLRGALAAGKAVTEPGGRVWQHGLVVAQAALAVLLTVGAGLLLHSFWSLWKVETGFAEESILTARLDPAAALYPETRQLPQLYEQVVERLEGTAGVAAAAATSRLPLGGDLRWMAHRVRNREFEDTLLPMASTNTVTAGYFETLGVPFVEGRDFGVDDTADSMPAVIVNRALAEAFWPGASAVGQAVGFPWSSPWLEIIGVVETIRDADLATEETPVIYFPHAQRPISAMSVIARTEVEPLSLAPTLRQMVREIDNQVPVNDVRTVEQVMWRSVAGPRLVVAVLSAFAAIALLLGAVGIYGVVSYRVAQRRQEIGVRQALGASRWTVLREVLAGVLKLAAGGIVLGLLASVAASRLLQARLFEVGALDPAAYVVAATLFLAVAIAAALRPAYRASRLDPQEVLRGE